MEHAWKNIQEDEKDEHIFECAYKLQLFAFGWWVVRVTSSYMSEHPWICTYEHMFMVPAQKCPSFAICVHEFLRPQPLLHWCLYLYTHPHKPVSMCIHVTYEHVVCVLGNQMILCKCIDHDSWNTCIYEHSCDLGENIYTWESPVGSPLFLNCAKWLLMYL